MISGRFAALLVLITFGADASAREKRDKDWLIDYLTQAIPDTPRNRHYLGFFERVKMLELLDEAWLEKGLESARGRDHAAYLSRMAFAYHTPGTRWHRD